MWLGAEYRFVAFDHVSLAGFLDAGKVAHDWEDIEFSRLKKAPAPASVCIATRRTLRAWTLEPAAARAGRFS